MFERVYRVRVEQFIVLFSLQFIIKVRSRVVEIMHSRIKFTLADGLPRIVSRCLIHLRA